MCCVRVAAEFELFGFWKLKHLFEILTDLHQGIPPTSFSGAASPQPNSIETLPHIDNHTHDFIVPFVLQRLTDCSELSVKPEFVNVDLLLVFEGV